LGALAGEEERDRRGRGAGGDGGGLRTGGGRRRTCRRVYRQRGDGLVERGLFLLLVVRDVLRPRFRALLLELALLRDLPFDSTRLGVRGLRVELKGVS
jgi:hypothetical protein